MTMCGATAFENYLEYTAVFPEIVDLLNASSLKARAKNSKTGILVNVVLPNRTIAVLSDGERDNWSINLNGEVIELSIPVQNRDAKEITAALLKALGE
jgi:hypothetical protein